MSLPAPIAISDQANAIAAWLNQWAQPKGGTAAVVSNLRDLWNQASLSSQKPRILICFNGATARGDFAHIAPWHREDRHWLVAITRGRGFNANRGDSLTEQTGDAEPFYDSVETVRDLLRRMIGISEEILIDYRSIKPMQLGNLVVDGFTIELSTANDVPLITNTADPTINQ
jgi:hypothetical protein